MICSVRSATRRRISHVKTKYPINSHYGCNRQYRRELTKGLFAHEVPFRAMVRSRKDAEAVDMLEGADVVVGDFNDSTSLAQALIEPFC